MSKFSRWVDSYQVILGIIGSAMVVTAGLTAFAFNTFTAETRTNRVVETMKSNAVDENSHYEILRGDINDLRRGQTEMYKFIVDHYSK